MASNQNNNKRPHDGEEAMDNEPDLEHSLVQPTSAAIQPSSPGFGRRSQPGDDDDDGEFVEQEEVEEADGLLSEDELTKRERKYFENELDDEEAGSDEDLFGEGYEKDYKESKFLDKYDENLVDDVNYSDLSEGQRRDVDKMLAKRDKLRALKEKGKDRGMFGPMDEEIRMKRRARRRPKKAQEEEDDDEYDPTMLDPDFILDDLKGRTVEEWVVLDQPRKHVAFRFKKFLREFIDSHGNNVYEEKIQRMCENNLVSLEVSWNELYTSQSILALWVADAPKPMLKIFHEVTTELVTERFEHYDKIMTGGEINVRITDLPAIEEIRDLRHHHVNKLIKVKGVVTKRSSVLPEVKFVTYGCMKCQHAMGPYYQQAASSGAGNSTLAKPIHCSSCDSKGPFRVISQQSQYRDFQKITLQESPGKVPPGRLPRQKEVILVNDLVDSVRPGEEIEVTGIYTNVYDIQLNVNNGFPLFQTVIEANFISKKEMEYDAAKLTNEDREKIQQLARDPRIGRRIIKSIAPSVYGHEDIKTALALSLFGGVAKNIQNKMRIRGDINVLMMGDPGTAKSQFLKYVEKTSARAVYTTGQGASAVGLTASVHRSPVTREWTLEGGALVLADQGVCLIDEFDKMNDQDRTSIHEAMEQQSISVSKAGIVCTLQARCAVIAAANPIGGRYIPTKSFQENVQLTEPILSRFDILCVVKDFVDVEKDERLARFVVNNHYMSHPDFQEGDELPDQLSIRDPDIIDQKLLCKYIQYAKHNVTPRLQQMDQDKLAQVYSSLRKESLSFASIPLTVRHVESMIRMAEAHAKMHLREYVIQDDLDLAIQTMLNSFLAANKSSVSKFLRKRFSRFLTVKGEFNELLHHLLQQIANDYYRLKLIENPRLRPTDGSDLIVDKVEFDADEFELKAREMNISDVSGFYKSNYFAKFGYSLDERIDDRGRKRRFIVKKLA